MKSLLQFASAATAALVLTGGIAGADPAKPVPGQPVALFVDLSEQVPAARNLDAKTLDLNGLPLLVGRGANNDVGLRAGDSLALGGGLSLDSRASLSRRVVPGAVFARGHGMSEMTAGATARLQQGGWDVAVFPELGTSRLTAGDLPDYRFGGSVARQTGDGWVWDATSRYEVRRDDGLSGAAGATAQGKLGISKLQVWGAALDLGYGYDWAQPRAEAATLSQGPAIALDLGLTDTLNCRVGYRYAFAGDLRAAGRGQSGQDFTIGWDWDLAAEGLSGTRFSAGLAHHRDYLATSPAESSGSINFATAF